MEGTLEADEHPQDGSEEGNLGLVSVVSGSSRDSCSRNLERKRIQPCVEVPAAPVPVLGCHSLENKTLSSAVLSTRLCETEGKNEQMTLGEAWGGRLVDNTRSTSLIRMAQQGAGALPRSQSQCCMQNRRLPSRTPSVVFLHCTTHADRGDPPFITGAQQGH